MTINDMIERLRVAANEPFGHYAGELPESLALVRVADIIRAADALTAAAEREKGLREALGIFLGSDDRFQVGVGGNPNAVERMLETARKALLAGVEDAQ